MAEVRQKVNKIQQEIRSEHKRKIFQIERKKLLEAVSAKDYQLANQTQNQIMKLFDSREQYQMTMKYAEEYQKVEAQYNDYLQHLEEQSINFQKIERQKVMREKKAQLLKHIEQLMNDQSK